MTLDNVMESSIHAYYDDDNGGDNNDDYSDDYGDNHLVMMMIY